MSTPDQNPHPEQDPTTPPPGYDVPAGYDSPRTPPASPANQSTPAAPPLPNTAGQSTPRAPYPPQDPYARQDPYGQQNSYGQGNGQPGQPRQPGQAANSGFSMPTVWPKSVADVLPSSGSGSIFSTDGLPSVLKGAYWMWLVVGFLSALGAVGTFFLSLRHFAVFSVATSLISLVLAVAAILVAIKLKEGFGWTRIVLTGITVVSFALSFFGGGVGWIGIIATVLLWLPDSTAWFNAQARNQRR